MSTAGVYNFTLDQGSVFYINLAYQNPDGTPINLTGMSAKMQLARSYRTPKELILSSPSNGIVITPLTGKIAVTITDEQTGLLGSGFYVYDLELDNAGVIDRIIQGTITVSPQVTV
jgi:hypothetical protein